MDSENKNVSLAYQLSKPLFWIIYRLALPQEDHIIHHIQGHNLLLLPEKAMIWKEEKKLILADIHIGKVTHFRKSGIALPPHAENDNYDRLSSILLNHDIDEVLILGDLFHSTYNEEWEKFARFIERFGGLKFSLVMGNHDILDTQHYQIDNLIVHPKSIKSGPFLFSHDKILSGEHYNIHGHIHPGIRLQGKGRQTLRLPCFYFGVGHAVMPAFGEFTGLHVLDINKSDDVYAIADQVIKVT